MYYMHMSLSDQMETDVSELRWIHGWLVDIKQKELKAMRGEKV